MVSLTSFLTSLRGRQYKSCKCTGAAPRIALLWAAPSITWLPGVNGSFLCPPPPSFHSLLCSFHSLAHFYSIHRAHGSFISFRVGPSFVSFHHSFLHSAFRSFHLFRSSSLHSHIRSLHSFCSFFLVFVHFVPSFFFISFVAPSFLSFLLSLLPFLPALPCPAYPIYLPTYPHHTTPPTPLPPPPPPPPPSCHCPFYYHRRRHPCLPTSLPIFLTTYFLTHIIDPQDSLLMNATTIWSTRCLSFLYFLPSYLPSFLDTLPVFPSFVFFHPSSLHILPSFLPSWSSFMFLRHVLPPCSSVMVFLSAFLPAVLGFLPLSSLFVSSLAFSLI